MQSLKNSERIYIRVNQREKAQLELLAAMANTSLSNFVKQMVLIGVTEYQEDNSVPLYSVKG